MHGVYVEISNCYNLFWFSILEFIRNSKADLYFHSFFLKEEGNHVSSFHQGAEIGLKEGEDFCACVSGCGPGWAVRG